MLQTFLLRLADWFIPVQLKSDEATLGRCRIFTITHLIGPCLGQTISIFLYFADPHRGLPFWMIVGGIAAFAALPFLLKWSKSLPALAFVSFTNLTFITLFGSFFYGGVSSPFLPWLLTALLLGFFYLGNRPVLVLTVFALNISGFYCAYAINGGFPHSIPLSDLSGVGIISVFSATVYVSMMALYYVNVVASQSELRRELDRHRITAVNLQQAKEKAERANQAKSVFLAKMSHQLRTPLNAVIGYSEILLEDAELTGADEQITDLRRINNAGKHLLALVTDVLDMSKIEADRIDLSLEPFDLGAFLDELVATSRSLVVRNGNQFALQSETALGTVISDPTRLRQITLNLLSNAGKFTTNGKIVLIAAREQTPAGDWIRIAIRDTGIGISAENLDRLFKDFNQAEASTASKYGGTGLGLALSRKLCRVLGGEIKVESTLGVGSCFTVRLPASPEAIARSGVSSGLQPQGARSHAA